MRDFRKIQVWRKSHELALRLYKVTSAFPILLAHDLGFINQEIYLELGNMVSEIKRMLYGFEKTVSSNAKKF